MTRIVYNPKRQVIKIAENKYKVVMAGFQGPDAVSPAEYADHIANRNNPHQVGLLQLKVTADMAGKWIKINAAGTAIETVAAPLTEQPVYPDPPDEKVKTDAADPNSGYLDAKVSGVLRVDATEHKLKLKGATGESVAASCYYGTNASGVLGFWPLPDLPTPIANWDNEEEWLDTNAIQFYEGL